MSKWHWVVVLISTLYGCVKYLEKVEPSWPPIDLSDKIISWQQRGQKHDVFGLSVFYIQIPYSGDKASDIPTFVLVHGFPTSSFDFVDLCDSLSKHGDVFMHDHVGFGFADHIVNLDFC